MKIMNVSLTIDVQNPQQVQALKQLIDSLGGNEVANPVLTAAPMADNGAAAPVAEKPTRTRKSKAVAEEPKYLEAEAEQAEEEMAQAPGPEEEDDLVGEEKPKVDLATLRALTAEKAILNRAVIKAKLGELGAANVTTIPENKYQEYFEFISSL